jgi:hypothetical protein
VRKAVVRRRWIALATLASLAGVVLAALGVASCGSQDLSSGSFVDFDSGLEGGVTVPSPFADSGSPTVEANAIVIVHAASFPAFRICFDGAGDDLPEPSTELMPDSNVVGVDVGTAVRLPARSDILGKAYVFAEASLRGFYPVGAVGPTCKQLLAASSTQDLAVAVGSVTEDLSQGVHALVLGGCRSATDDPMATTARCGGDWQPATGNLKLVTLSLMAYARAGETRLAVQLVQLSPALQRRADGRAFGLGFGSLDASAPAPFVEGTVPFGKAVPNPPAILDYAASDLESYGTSGVFVTLGGPVDDAGAPIVPEAGADASGPREVVLAQSLADIQKRSSPRSLPPDWFSFASSYVVLSVGDTDPRLGDGGVDDDPRRALHLLAIPLATPDAGTTTGDAGAQ